ncbi:Telomere repeat-binding factor 1 [Hondaea fermentalgiana]|uniref:Telomere repeat-binding factor 1 n=1 Tax=Hondaea fermentalgiana TaxID=2315210 RepID=A0A2R5G3N6_9STRA|nr:Telomere repeat-binding factor 1 [Hondaea fermentalgiana]|eukprot:GBG24368.1 Telomere repeat-binding factor 1 [Hondaea fermentalgiana]
MGAAGAIDSATAAGPLTMVPEAKFKDKGGSPGDQDGSDSKGDATAAAGAGGGEGSDDKQAKGKAGRKSTTKGKKRPLDVSKYPLHFRTKRGRRRFWTKEELAALLKGVSRYGSGNWVHIKCDPELGQVLHQRTTVDIKDKWRTYKREEQRRREGKAKSLLEPSKTTKRAKRTLRDTEDFPGAIVSDPSSQPPPPPVLDASGTMMMGSAIYDRDFAPEPASAAAGDTGASRSTGGARGAAESDLGFADRLEHPHPFRQHQHPAFGAFHEHQHHQHHGESRRPSSYDRSLFPGGDDGNLGFETSPLPFPFPDPMMSMPPPPAPAPAPSMQNDSQPEFWTVRMQLLHPEQFSAEISACGDAEHLHVINVAHDSQTKDLAQYLITQWFKNPQLNPNRYRFHFDALRLHDNDFLATKGLCDKSTIWVEVDPNSPLLLPTPAPIVPTLGNTSDPHLQ